MDAKARGAALVFLLASCAFLPSPIHAGSPVYVGAEVPAEKRVSLSEVRHDVWDELLRKHVDEEGLVDYGAWKHSKAELRKLDRYLDHLATAKFTEGDRVETVLAYWINAYNAVTVKGILREYPTTSIRNHTAALFGYNIWKDLQLRVDGKAYSLDQIEHEILRMKGEPRIHFAIVCASIGCPRLLNEAYLDSKLEKQLSDNAIQFFATPGKFSFDLKAKEIRVSPILEWFATDFGKSHKEQLATIAPYLPDAARPLARSGTCRVKYLAYDWNLNDAKRSKK